MCRKLAACLFLALLSPYQALAQQTTPGSIMEQAAQFLAEVQQMDGVRQIRQKRDLGERLTCRELFSDGLRDLQTMNQRIEAVMLAGDKEVFNVERAEASGLMPPTVVLMVQTDFAYRCGQSPDARAVDKMTEAIRVFSSMP